MQKNGNRMKKPDITCDKTKILQRNIAELLNQPESSDIVPVVNNARYYACSYILASSMVHVYDLTEFHEDIKCYLSKNSKNPHKDKFISYSIKYCIHL